MSKLRKILTTTVGDVDSEILSFTVGKDTEYDLLLVEADCVGTAAHVTMLSKMPCRPPLITGAERAKVIAELVKIINEARRGTFRITTSDQDVHMAVERRLTKRLGAIGRKIHTCRSRNDQVAVDLRLYGRTQLTACADEAVTLALVLVDFAFRNRHVPMVGRTHMQPAMPSSVGLWASAYAESLLDDASLLMSIYEQNDRCPLGSAAGYGVPLQIDRQLTASLLGFSGPVHNVLHAGNTRGKMESLVLSGCGQVMLSLSRLAQDLILFSMPEFGYFGLPAEYCTGSSIMPQKNNPDVLELVRARAASVLSCGHCVSEIVRALPSGYNRDLQETKGPFIDGVLSTLSSLRAMGRIMNGVTVDERRLTAAFTPAVHAADRALEMAAAGMPFRDAYRFVKEHLGDLAGIDAAKAVAARKHLGAPGGLDFKAMKSRCSSIGKTIESRRQTADRAISSLLRAGSSR
ncbi:MAG: argininosuccinate lyase [bacterium]